MKVIGVTGTDGKTTTSFLLYQILERARFRILLIFTVGAYLDGKVLDTGLHVTTPSSFLLQSILRKARVDYTIIEATSHGLEQNRLWGVNFDLGLLTNITHEHLDYHRTFDNYCHAKARLFQASRASFINNEYSFFASYLKGRDVVLYSAKDVPYSLLKVIRKRFKEDYNIENAVSAFVLDLYLGVDKKTVALAVEVAKLPEGGLKEIENTREIRVFVDFAHTPNGLKKVLKSVRSLILDGGRLIVVFGCAGRRDKEKRPIMGRIAGKLADVLILTSEDPRDEDPVEIIRKIESGKKNSRAEFYKELHRGKAIIFALNNIAKKGDVVLICGKGYEKSMNIGGVEYEWFDKKAVLLSFQKESLDYKKIVNQ